MVSDTHYGAGGAEGARAMALLVEAMNRLPGTEYPAAVADAYGQEEGRFGGNAYHSIPLLFGAGGGTESAQ